MGCFLACFGSSKDATRRRNQRCKVLPRDPRFGIYRPVQLLIATSNQDKTEAPISHISEIRDVLGEQTSFGKRKKVVTFDSNIKTYEPENTNYALESIERSGETEEEGLISKSSKAWSHFDDGSSYPLNHRYQNCRDSDDEIEESDFEASDLEEDEDPDDNEEYYESEVCDSISLMDPRTENSAHKTTTDKKVVYSVLNPVENLTQWKTVKAREIPKFKNQKENVTLEQEPPHISFTLEPNVKYPKHQNQEITVEASLSSWIVSSEPARASKNNVCKNSSISFERNTNEKGSNSPLSIEERPILGALTVEQGKQIPTTSSPRKSPSRNPDDMYIIGSVGSYWSRDDSDDKDSGSVVTSSFKGIPNTTRKYREENTVIWHSTPFEKRLERALNTGAAEAYSEV